MDYLIANWLIFLINCLLLAVNWYGPWFVINRNGDSFQNYQMVPVSLQLLIPS
jgi:hypothetical protein